MNSKEARVTIVKDANRVGGDEVESNSGLIMLRPCEKEVGHWRILSKGITGFHVCI